MGLQGRVTSIESQGNLNGSRYMATGEWCERVRERTAKDLVRGDHPNSWKNAPRMQGQMKIFRVCSRQFRESLRELLRELWVSYWSSRERPFREWNFVFREWNFQFRELLREYPGTLRELREWPFHSESVFPEIGVVPRLLKRRSETDSPKSVKTITKVQRRSKINKNANSSGGSQA